MHTNGIIVREVIVRNVKYRFIDSSGYFSHVDEWEQSIRESDAVLFVVDSQGIDSGLFFTKEIFEKVAPFVQKNKVPSYVLVNRATENQSLQPVIELMDQFLPKVKHSCGAARKFGEDLDKMFEWIEETIVTEISK